MAHFHVDPIVNSILQHVQPLRVQIVETRSSIQVSSAMALILVSLWVARILIHSRVETYSVPTANSIQVVVMVWGALEEVVSVVMV